MCDSEGMTRKIPAVALNPVYLECEKTGRHKQRGCREKSILREEPSSGKPSTCPPRSVRVVLKLLRVGDGLVFFICFHILPLA